MRPLIFKLAPVLLLAALPCAALAQKGPGIPEALYGRAEGAPGALVEALINGIAVASTTISASGTYGYAPHPFFILDASNTHVGADITFAIDGAPVLQHAVFANGAVTALDLSFTLASSTVSENSVATSTPLAGIAATTATSIPTSSGGGTGVVSSGTHVSTHSPPSIPANPVHTLAPTVGNSIAVSAPEPVPAEPAPRIPSVAGMPSVAMVTQGVASLAAAAALAPSLPLEPILIVCAIFAAGMLFAYGLMRRLGWIVQA